MPALPTQLDSFVGRETELGDASRLLAGARLLTVVGPGGVGKTRLALELAARVAAADPDEIWLVDLTSAGGDVPAQVVAATVGIREEPRDGLIEALAAVLGRRRSLLVLDNCEHVVEPAAALVEALLRRCPELRALATSQELLGVPGEVVFPLAGLAVPTGGNQPRGAVRLFVDRARECRPDFEATPQVTAEVAQICARLDGLPLCIELAARWVRSLTTTEILTRLDDRFALLTSSARTVADRHRSLRAVIEWSYHLLDDKESDALRRLAVLPGGFDLDGAVVVCGDGLSAAETLHVVDRLQAKSLLARAEAERGATRFRLLESIRLYALEQLDFAGETAATRDRAATWLAELCAPLADNVFQSELLLSRLNEERDNIAAALDHLLAARDERASLMASALAACWRRLGWVDRARDLLDSVRAQGFGRDGLALNLAALLASDQRDWDQARALAGEVVAAERPKGVTVALIRALQTFAVVADDLGEHAEAERYLAECVQLSSELDRALLTAMCRQNLAWGILQGGDMARAEALLAETLPEMRRLAPDPTMLSGILHTIGVLAIKSGDLDRAEEHLRENLAVARLDRLSARYALDGLAVVAAERSDAERAVRLAAAVQAMVDGSAPMTEVLWVQEVADAVGRCRDALGPTRAAAAWAEGGKATVDEIIAYALGGDWPEEPDVPVLSDRESEVAGLVAEGLTNREIAARLGLSSRTVDSHLEHIRAKLGLRSRAQVAAWAASSSPEIR